MNSTPAGSPPWSPRRWVAVVLAVFTLQLALLWLGSARTAPAPPAAAASLTVRWLTDPVLARRVLDAHLLNDPTLFAMASRRGFSGAWLRPQSPGFQFHEWSTPERALGQPTQSLGGAFAMVASAGGRPVFDPARKPPTVAPGVAAFQPALRTASRLVIEGPVRARPLMTPPALRSWSHPDVLADSRVQVLVNAEGLVFSPRLAGGGTRSPAQLAADQHALELARTLRFAPVPKPAQPGALAEGVLVFQWHTVPPPAGGNP